MLRDEIARYTELSGNDGLHTPIGIIGAYLDGYEKGRADAPQWIPVAERVPEVGTYIVTGRQKYDWEDKWHYFVDVAYCPGNYVDFFWDTFNDWDEGQETHIIAWMPLPEPWKGEDDETD